MPPKELILDVTTLDLDHVVADLETIRKYNPQRFEMEQLTAVVHEDLEHHVAAGYKDVTDKEFWVRGHMPDMPLMPGVIMCEAAAQLCSYYAQRSKLCGDNIVGLGGLEEVRFRDPVRPGDRLVLVSRVERFRRGMMVVFRFQGFVEGNLILEGGMKGISLPAEELRADG